jgi:GTP-binding protein LepA
MPVLASAKVGKGIPEILEAIVERVPQTTLARGNWPLRTLIFDCVYDAYKGVICYIRTFSGSLKRGDTILLMSDGTKAEVKEVGIFSPGMRPVDTLGAGSVGYIVTNIKEVAEIKIGDTITQFNADPATEMLPGYKEVRPMVFSGIYPIDTSDYEKLKVSVGKLQLNDAALRLRGGDLHRPRFRFSLRLPRAPAHGSGD